MLIRFAVGNVSEERVACIFAAYLLGRSKARPRENGPPFFDGDRWQLDEGNDYWLRVEEGEARLTYRYESQEPIASAMVRLFTARYPRD